MQSVKFVVNETPYVCWDPDLKSKNLEFLKGIDPEYLQYTLDVHLPQLEKDPRVLAAMSLRIAYSQGLEALFALLAATIQAPECVIGWMLTYRNFQLDEIVIKLSKGESLLSRLKVPNPTWTDLSKWVHAYLSYEESKKGWIARGFASLWNNFARDYLDNVSRNEYNSLKHGLRPRPGGFILRSGEESTRGVAAPPEGMQTMGGSDFGSTFFIREKIDEDKISFRPRRTSRNWHPLNLANGLGLLKMSLRNVLSFLLILNGEKPEQCMFKNPDNETAFNSPWAEKIGVSSFNMDTIVGKDDIDMVTKEDVLNSYYQQ